MPKEAFFREAGVSEQLHKRFERAFGRQRSSEGPSAKRAVRVRAALRDAPYVGDVFLTGGSRP